MNDFPMNIHVAYKERQNGLITLFKLILVIPWGVWLYLWNIAFSLLVILAWFILVFTAKWPKEFFSFGLAFVRYQARVTAWLLNLTDRWPPWLGKPDPEYGLTLEIEQQPRYNRWKTGFRYILSLPVAALAGLVFYFYTLVFSFLAYWAIIFSGRLPKWCYQQLADTFAWYQRVNAYSNLFIERYPPFAGQDEAPSTPRVAPAPAPPITPPDVAA